MIIKIFIKIGNMNMIIIKCRALFTSITLERPKIETSNMNRSRDRDRITDSKKVDSWLKAPCNNGINQQKWQYSLGTFIPFYSVLFTMKTSTLIPSTRSLNSSILDKLIRSKNLFCVSDPIKEIYNWERGHDRHAW